MTRGRPPILDYHSARAAAPRRAFAPEDGFLLASLLASTLTCAGATGYDEARVLWLLAGLAVWIGIAVGWRIRRKRARRQAAARGEAPPPVRKTILLPVAFSLALLAPQLVPRHKICPHGEWWYTSCGGIFRGPSGPCGNEPLDRNGFVHHLGGHWHCFIPRR